MATVLSFRLHGTTYGAYPDAHSILSILYTAGYTDPDLYVSSLLPFVNDKLYLPAPTSVLGEFGGSKNRVKKGTISKIKKGTIYVPSDRIADAEDLSFWEDSDDLDAVIIGEFRNPRNSLDRVSSSSNLYFESGWYAKSFGGGRKVDGFAVVLDGNVDLEGVCTSLTGMPLGGNKTHGAVIVDVRKQQGIETNREGGLLISIARPSDRPPECIPILREKWAFYNDGEGVKRKAYSLYCPGSVLSEGEYVSGDVSVGKDVRGYDVKLFVRPLFVNLTKG